MVLLRRLPPKGWHARSACFCCRTNCLSVGDYVMVHVGYAIQTMSAAEAQSAWELYDEMLAIEAALPRA